MKRLAPMAALCTVMVAGCQQRPDAPVDALTTPVYVRAVAYLVQQSRSDDPSVRANCIEALQRAKDPRAVNVIEQGLHDEQWVVRFSAAMAAGQRRAAAVRPVLETLAVSDTSGSVRVASVYALKQLGDARRMGDLARALGSTDASTRANTALILGLLGEPSAIPLLQAHLNETDIRVRFELTAALARLGDLSAQRVIASWAVNRFAEDQWSAMAVCADLPREVGANPLLLGIEPVSRLPADMTKLSADDVKNLTTRRQLVAARSLAKMKIGQGERIATIAVDNLNNPVSGLRALAILALGDMLTPDRVPGIVPYLNDSDEGVRRATAAAIVNIFTRAEKAG